MDLKEFKSYFSKKITPPMKSYAEYLIDYCGGNYMMLYDPNDRAKAICTRCRRKINLKSEVKHLKIAATDQCMRKIGILGNDGSCDLVHLSKCPNCSNAYLAVHLWRLTNMDKYDFRGLFNWWEKSPRDPKTVTCRGIEIYRTYDLHGKFHDHYRDVAYYLFRPGEKPLQASNRPVEWWEQMGEYIQEYKYKLYFDRKLNDVAFRSENGGFGASQWFRGNCYNCMDSFNEAIIGTHLQYCQAGALDLDVYRTRDKLNLIHYIDLYLKHPWVEMLIKMHLKSLIEDYIKSHDYAVYQGTLNWRASKPDKIFGFKLTRADRQFLAHPGKTNIDSELFTRVRGFRQAGLQISFQEAAQKQLKELSPTNLKTYTAILATGSTSKDRIDRYIAKYQDRHALNDYVDYLHDLQVLKMALDKSNLFPKDFRLRHQQILEAARMKKDRALEAKLQKTIKERNKIYCYQDSDFLIRPVKSISEIIIEGKLQHNCVGGYAKRYAEGDTDILVLRRLADPSIPYVTVEIMHQRKCTEKPFRLIQARLGYNNPIEDKNTEAFLENYLEHLNNKKNKSKRKEVAA